MLYYLRIFYVNYVRNFNFWDFLFEDVKFNLQICTPSNVPYTATKAATIFKYALLAALSISTIAVAFFISEVTVSKSQKIIHVNDF